MIEATRDKVLNDYSIKNGYKYDSEVVYGDTDSVMIKFGVKTVAEAIEVGKEAAISISKIFKAPIKLEFEKVYWPYLLMGKKRYAGLYWTNAEKYDKLDCKGIESVRRDNCKLLRDTIKKILDYILIQRDVPTAIDYTKFQITRLL